MQVEVDSVAAIEEAVVTIVRELSLASTQERLIGAAGVSVERAGFGVLRCLSERGASRVSELAQSLGVDVSTMSRHVTTLQRGELVARTDDPLDGRAARIELTSAGVIVLGLLREARHRYFSELLADWSDDERRALVPLLARLANGILETEGRG
ncbi:MAG: MarR family transcriptional regulator [Microbacteriaceae bacterium]